MTLIELLVGMVVLMLVMAMMTRALGSSFLEKSSVAADVAATTSADRASDQLGSDLRSAINTSAERLTADDLYITTGVAPSRDPAVNNGAARQDIRDILLASEYEMQFLLDTDQDPSKTGSQKMDCVVYRIDDQGTLWRAVFPTTFTVTAGTNSVSCNTTGAPKQLTRLIVGVGDISTGTAKGIKSIDSMDSDIAAQFYHPINPADPNSPNIASVRFRYGVATPLPPVAPSVLPTNRCTQTNSTAPAAAQYPFIMTVDMKVQPRILQRDHIAEETLENSITIRSRIAASYRRAVGCGVAVQVN